MSTRFDIIDAKHEHERHSCQGHPYPCPVKVTLWLAWMRTAGRWGLPEGDESHQDRQARQYAERVPGGPRG